MAVAGLLAINLAPTNAAAELPAFEAPYRIVRADPTTVAARFVDINRDGLTDLVTATYRLDPILGARGGVRVLYGQGSAVLGPEVSLGESSHIPTGLAVDDVNGDGVADIITALESATGGGIDVRIVSSTGSIAAPVRTETFSDIPSRIQVGVLGEAPALFFSTVIGNRLGVTFHTDGGALAPPVTSIVPTPLAAWTLFRGSTSPNSRLVTLPTTGNGISIYPFDDAGVRGPGSHVATSDSIAAVAGEPEGIQLGLTCLGWYSGNLISLTPDAQGGLFERTHEGPFAPRTYATFRFTATDVDGDATPELGLQRGDSLVVLDVSGAGDSSWHAPMYVPGSPESLDGVDPDADGTGQFALQLEVAGSMLLTRVSGQPIYLVTPAPTTSIAVGDLDIDGIDDLALGQSKWSVFGGWQGSMEIFFGSVSPASSPSLSFSLGKYPSGIAVIPGRPSVPAAIIVADQYDDVLREVTLENGGIGQVTIIPAGTSPANPVIADFNEDGRPDVGVATKDGSLARLLFGGPGEFGPPVSLARNCTRLGVIDYNQDGHADLICHDDAGRSLSILQGNGSGDFVPTHIYGIGGCELVGDSTGYRMVCAGGDSIYVYGLVQNPLELQGAIKTGLADQLLLDGSGASSDGTRYLLVRGFDGVATSSAMVRKSEAGTLELGRSFPTVLGIVPPRFGDLTADGVVDLVDGSQTRIVVTRGVGDGGGNVEIEETHAEAAVATTLWPNPARRYCYWEVRTPFEGIVRWEILDVQGRRRGTIFEGRAGEGLVRLEGQLPDGLPTGIYFLRLSNSEGTLRTGRIVIMN